MKLLEEEVKYLKETNLQQTATIATLKAMLDDRQSQDRTISTPTGIINNNNNNNVLAMTRAVTFPATLSHVERNTNPTHHQMIETPMKELIRHESLKREIQNVNLNSLTPHQRNRLAALVNPLQRRIDFLREELRQQKERESQQMQQEQQVLANNTATNLIRSLISTGQLIVPSPNNNILVASNNTANAPQQPRQQQRQQQQQQERVEPLSYNNDDNEVEELEVMSRDNSFEILSNLGFTSEDELGPLNFE